MCAGGGFGLAENGDSARQALFASRRRRDIFDDAMSALKLGGLVTMRVEDDAPRLSCGKE